MIDRLQVAHMAQMQNMIDFPPAPKLDPMTARLDRKKATDQEIQGEDLFFGKARCVACHQPPAYTDHMMHDLKLERFGAEADGPIKTFVLRGIKDSPPYFHDGREKVWFVLKMVCERFENCCHRDHWNARSQAPGLNGP